MKKLLLASILTLALALAFSAGRTAGISHALATAGTWITEEGGETVVNIEVDGNWHTYAAN